MDFDNLIFTWIPRDRGKMVVKGAGVRPNVRFGSPYISRYGLLGGFRKKKNLISAINEKLDNCKLHMDPQQNVVGKLELSREAKGKYNLEGFLVHCYPSSNLSKDDPSTWGSKILLRPYDGRIVYSESLVIDRSEIDFSIKDIVNNYTNLGAILSHLIPRG